MAALLAAAGCNAWGRAPTIRPPALPTSARVRRCLHFHCCLSLSIYPGLPPAAPPLPPPPPALSSPTRTRTRTHTAGPWQPSHRIFLSPATLVVVPPTLIDHWRGQIRMHVERQAPVGAGRQWLEGRSGIRVVEYTTECECGALIGGEAGSGGTLQRRGRSTACCVGIRSPLVYTWAYVEGRPRRVACKLQADEQGWVDGSLSLVLPTSCALLLIKLLRTAGAAKEAARRAGRQLTAQLLAWEADVVSGAAACWEPSACLLPGAGCPPPVCAPPPGLLFAGLLLALEPSHVSPSAAFLPTLFM